MAAFALVVSGCVANPPPARQETQAAVPINDDTGGTKIVVAIDTIGNGLNPHLIADQGPVTNAIAAMTLPSPFRPVPTPAGTVWQQDSSLVPSALITSTDPFTVTYTLNQNAQWSDGLPVTADDFSYLWRQMITQPDVISPAGYRLITDVQSRAGGKEAVVRFARPYPAWRELFSGLLPSHVLRGAPGGFQSGIDSGIPPSAGPFSINNIDRSRDEIRLVRNDRYWTAPAVADKVFLRRIGDTSQLAESIRSNDTGAVSVLAGNALQTQLSAIPGTVTGRVAASRALGLTLNVRSPAVSDVNVRHAILGLVDTNLLTAASAGDAVVTPFANTVLAPTDPGYYPVEPVRLDPAAADDLLRRAGYVRAADDENASGAGAATDVPDSSSSPVSAPVKTSTVTPTPGSTATPTVSLPAGVRRIERDGKPLQITVGVVRGDERASMAAASLVDQLRSAGIESSVTAVAGTELYGSALANSGIDVIVGWSTTGVDPATRLASQTACPGAAPAATGGVADSSSIAPATSSAGVSAPASGGDAATEDTEFSGNVSGVCDPALSDVAGRALVNPNPIDDLRAAEPMLAGQFVYLPIYQDSMFTLAGPSVSGVPQSGPVQTGIFVNTGQWKVIS